MQSEKNIKEFLSSTNPENSILNVYTLGGKLSVSCKNNASIDQKYNFTIARGQCFTIFSKSASMPVPATKSQSVRLRS